VCSNGVSGLPVPDVTNGGILANSCQDCISQILYEPVFLGKNLLQMQDYNHINTEVNQICNYKVLVLFSWTWYLPLSSSPSACVKMGL